MTSRSFAGASTGIDKEMRTIMEKATDDHTARAIMQTIIEMNGGRASSRRRHMRRGRRRRSPMHTAMELSTRELGRELGLELGLTELGPAELTIELDVGAGLGLDFLDFC